MNLFGKKKSAPGAEPPSKGPNWLKISVLANIAILVVVAGVAAGAEVIHQSDTNPGLCRLCHVMASHVDSYLAGGKLDNMHQQAHVQCKGCHDYSIQAELASGLKFVTGNYIVSPGGELPKRTFDDTMCLQCHISTQHLAQLTDDLARNPHDSHWGPLPCNTCHIAHGAQIDYCSQCHENGGQRLIGQPVKAGGTTGG